MNIWEKDFDEMLAKFRADHIDRKYRPVEAEKVWLRLQDIIKVAKSSKSMRIEHGIDAGSSGKKKRGYPTKKKKASK